MYVIGARIRLALLTPLNALLWKDLVGARMGPDPDKLPTTKLNNSIEENR